MDIMLMTDIEGITNVDDISMVFDEGEGYKQACLNLMDDTNTVIKAYFDAGADNVYVIDGHGGGDNFIMDMLDKRAIKVDGSTWGNIIESGTISAFAEVGLHAMSGTQNAFLDHTQSSSRWFDYKINGKCCGELIQGAGYMGAFNIPMIFVSGDVAVCEEAKKFINGIATAAVKYAVGRNHAISLNSNDARKLLYDTAKKSVNLIGKIKPYKIHEPAEISVTFQRADYADAVMASHDNYERLDARTVRKFVDTIKSYKDFNI